MKLFRKRNIKPKKIPAVIPSENPIAIQQHKGGVPKPRRINPNAVKPVSANTSEVNISDANPPPPVGIGQMTMRDCPNCGNRTLNLEGLCSSCGYQEIGPAHPTWSECPNCGKRTVNEEGICQSCGWHEIGPAHPIP